MDSVSQGKILLPRVLPEQVASFFRLTENRAQELFGTEFPVYSPFPGGKRFCNIEISTLSGLNWKKSRTVKQVDRHGNPWERPTGNFIVVDANDVMRLDYQSKSGAKLCVVRDSDDPNFFLAMTDVRTLVPVVEQRLSEALAPLVKWISY